MGLKLGTAPDSWGVWFADDAKQPPWRQFLDEAALAGYRWIELGPYGYLPTEAAVLRSELEQRRLQVSGTFVMVPLADIPWSELELQLAAVGAQLAALEAQYVVLIDDTYSDLHSGELLTERELDKAGWARLVANVTRAAAFVRERYGLRLVFHPHAETHVEYEPQIERLLADTDPSLVSLCLDVGHHAYRGGDPVAFLRKHFARIGYLHLKSVASTVRLQAGAERLPFAAAVARGIFCEPSAGTVNFPALGALLQEKDYDGFAIVEQDMYPAPFDKPLPIARRTYAYFKDMGLV